MKKLLAFLLTLVGVVGLVSCDKTPVEQPDDPKTGEQETQDPETEVTLTDITLTVEQETVNVDYGSSYRVLEGVKAVGNDGVSYALKVVASCETAAITDGKLDTKVSGTHVIKLVLDYQGIHKEATKTVIVGEKPDTSGNLLANPNFDAAYTGWTKFEDGSAVSWETEEIDGVSYAKVVETAVSMNPYSPRLHNSGSNTVTFYTGTKYKVSFEAKAEAAKTIQCQAGQLIGGAPYFYDFAGQVYEFELGTSFNTYSFTFAMGTPDPAADITQGSITLELGTVSGDSTATTIWIGNIVVEEFEGEIADTVAPTIFANNKTIFIGDCETVDLNSFVSANDAVDGDVTPSYVIKNAAGEVVQSISGAVAGVYTVEITAVDAAGNDATSTITVTVKEKVVLENAIGEIDGVAKGDAATPLTAPGKFVYWTVDDAGWGCGPVTVVDASFENGVVKFVNTTNDNPNAWGIQAFYAFPELVQAGAYKLSVDVKSSVAGSITIHVGTPGKDASGNNTVNSVKANIVDLVAGENSFNLDLGNLEAGVQYEIQIIFGTQNNGEAPIGSGTFEFSNWNLCMPVNAFGSFEEIAFGGAQDLAANPGKFLYWAVGDVNWNCGPVTETTVTYENGVLKFVNDPKDNTNAWSIQAFYTIPELEEAGEYTLSCTINSSLAGNITILVAGVPHVVELVEGVNNVSFSVGELASGQSYQLQIVFGTQGPEVPIGAGTFEFSDWKLVK